MTVLLGCFRRGTIPSMLTRNFTPSSSGGISSCLTGKVSAFGLFQVCCLSFLSHGSVGSGAFLKGHWFVDSWSPSQHQQSITFNKLFPVVIFLYFSHPGTHAAGGTWCKKHVLFLSDNNAVVHILNNSTSEKVPCLTHFLYNLLF